MSNPWSTKLVIVAVVIIASMLSFAVGAAVSAGIAWRWGQPSEEAPPPVLVDTRECPMDGMACSRFGIAGTCLSERCLLPSGYCNYDLDCDDANPCTSSRCDLGRCVAVNMDGACTLDVGAPGVCLDRSCVPTPPGACATDADCPTLTGACSRWQCVSGACAAAALPEQTECRQPSGLEGTCQAGSCTRDLVGEVRNATTCSTKYVPYGYYYRVPVRDCDAGLVYLLSDEDRARATGKVQDDIFESLRYSMAVSLVPLPDGGYNIIAINRHDRATVEGLVDPSFVAFTIAGFTSSSNWRSRQLHVWLRAYQEGWSIPTAGSRFAVTKGRANSALGFLGVVDVPAFRKYLQQSFSPLPSVAPAQEQVSLVVATTPAPATMAPPTSP